MATLYYKHNQIEEALHYLQSTSNYISRLLSRVLGCVGREMRNLFVHIKRTSQ